jgi:hypothetical protein
MFESRTLLYKTQVLLTCNTAGTFFIALRYNTFKWKINVKSKYSEKKLKETMKQSSNRDEAGTWRIRCSTDTYLMVTFGVCPKELPYPEKVVNVVGWGF